MMLQPVFIDVFHKSWIINQDLGKIGEKDSLVKYPGKKTMVALAKNIPKGHWGKGLGKKGIIVIP